MTASPASEPHTVAGPGGVCPYLRASTGNWRAVEPTREHVCVADGFPAPVGLEAQRRLCLDAYQECSRFQAARQARESVAPIRPSRPMARTTPVIIERARPALSVPAFGGRRAVGQALLAALMLLAVIALVVARIDRRTGPGQPGASDAAAGAGASSPSASSSPTASPPSAVSPSPSVRAAPSPSHGPAASPTAAATRTYRVRSGDTLLAIAARFGTTVKALAALNGISDPSLIHVGQVLKIP